MSVCYPKYRGVHSPPYPRHINRKRRGEYSQYYLSRAFDPESPPSKWINKGEGDISYRKPTKSKKKRSRKSPKKSKKRRSPTRSIRRSKPVRKRRYRNSG